jgi:Uma2 family endonuclease
MNFEGLSPALQLPFAFPIQRFRLRLAAKSVRAYANVMSATLESAIEPFLHSPRLPEILETLQARVRDESARRRQFYEDLRDDQQAEFIDGEVVMHSPARDKHIVVRQHLEMLLHAHVGLRRAGKVRAEKCLCVFPRNDYEPDIVFFGPEKAARLNDGTMKFPIPDFVVEILSESTEARDRGVKFEDFEAHGVAEYWIIDADDEIVEQYLRRGGSFNLALKSGSGEIASPTVPGFRIPLRALFDPAENLAALRPLMETAS